MCEVKFAYTCPRGGLVDGRLMGSGWEWGSRQKGTENCPRGGRIRIRTEVAGWGQTTVECDGKGCGLKAVVENLAAEVGDGGLGRGRDGGILERTW